MRSVWGQLHYRTNYEQLVNHTALLLAKYDALRTSPGAARLIWREVSPQHFAKNKGGLWHGEKAPVQLPCEAHHSADTAIANGANLALYDTLRKFPWVLQLPIWEMSAQRADAHTRYECTHWCQPGPLSTWIIMLQHLLHAQPPQSSPSRGPGGAVAQQTSTQRGDCPRIKTFRWRAGSIASGLIKPRCYRHGRFPTLTLSLIRVCGMGCGYRLCT